MFIVLSIFLLLQVNDVVLCDLARVMSRSKRGQSQLSKLATEDVLDILHAMQVTEFKATDFNGKKRMQNLKKVSLKIVEYVQEKCECLDF